MVSYNNEVTPLIAKIKDGIDEDELRILEERRKEFTGKDMELEFDCTEELEEIPEWTKREIFITFLTVVSGKLFYFGV